MGERLEKFIKDNRKEFDEFEPSHDIWNKIEKQLDESERRRPREEKVVKLKLVLRAAAAVLVVCSVALWFSKKAGSPVNIAEINPELAKQQMQYASQIEHKKDKLIEIKSLEPQLYKEFSSDLEKLQTNYRQLQKELKTSPNQERTLRAMIRNLQVQAEMLSQQLQIIKQLQELKQEEGTSNDETKGI